MAAEELNALVVEDDREIARLIEEKFIAGGWRVLKSAKTAEASFKINNQKFNCIIMDMNLENGKGEDLILGLRKNKLSPNHQTPIFVVSGTLDASRIALIRDHVQAILVKPFDVGHLLTKANQLGPNGK